MSRTAAMHMGHQAERQATRHLRWRGWRIIARNWIGGGGELDIVASRWRTLLVVEVRKRPTTEQGFESVDRAKLGRTVKAAHTYIRHNKLDRYRLRIDVMVVDNHGRLTCHQDVMDDLPGAV